MVTLAPAATENAGTADPIKLAGIKAPPVERVRSRSRSPSRTTEVPDAQAQEKSAVEDEERQRAVDKALEVWTPFDWLSLAGGVLVLLVVGLPVGAVIFTAMLWEAVDRRFDGGFVNSGKELTGPLFTKIVPTFTELTQKFNEKFVKRPQDAYMMNCVFVYGSLMPLMFFGCAYHVRSTGSVNWLLVYVYHVLRIGPFFQNFAYVYTLCHKEGHSRAGLYKEPYNSCAPLRNVFNWWVGMFYGVLPATFAYGHSLNHHRYNNGPKDVISTSDRPRDSFVNWVAYLPRYISYAVNFSTIIQFASERNWKVVQKTTIGSLWFFAWILVCAWFISPMFAIAYVSFPFFEASLLLAAVNWSWHAFLDPANPNNEYVQSITILDGRVNVLNEDAHVVHHQYPGGHWSDHPKYMEKHWGAYAEHSASVFRGTHAFEIFGMSVAGNYEELADKYVDMHGESSGKLLTKEQRVDLMKNRRIKMMRVMTHSWEGCNGFDHAGGVHGQSNLKRRIEALLLQGS